MDEQSSLGYVWREGRQWRDGIAGGRHRSRLHAGGALLEAYEGTLKSTSGKYVEASQHEALRSGRRHLGPLGSYSRDHVAEVVIVGTQAAWIDVELAPIIHAMWRLGIETEFSCQDHNNRGTHFSIKFKSSKDLATFLRMTLPNDDSPGSMCDRATGATRAHSSGGDVVPESRWSFLSVFPTPPWEALDEDAFTLGGEGVHAEIPRLDLRRLTTALTAVEAALSSVIDSGLADGGDVNTNKLKVVTWKYDEYWKARLHEARQIDEETYRSEVDRMKREFPAEVWELDLTEVQVEALQRAGKLGPADYMRTRARFVEEARAAGIKPRRVIIPPESQASD